MEQNRSFTYSQSRETTFDAGLQKHFQQVYNIMALGLAVTGTTAFAVAQIPGVESVFASIAQNPIIALAVAFAPMMAMMALFNPHRMRTASFQSLVLGFVGFSAFFGALMASIFMVYSPESIIKTFFITAATFAATSIYGYKTKSDLSGMGSMLRMAVIGLFLAVIVNLFLQSPVMHMAISAVGVLIYTGLTAWDTQQIKETYRYSYSGDTTSKLAVMGALGLYMNFIMLFQFLLQFMGNRE